MSQHGAKVDLKGPQNEALFMAVSADDFLLETKSRSARHAVLTFSTVKLRKVAQRREGVLF